MDLGGEVDRFEENVQMSGSPRIGAVQVTANTPEKTDEIGQGKRAVQRRGIQYWITKWTF